MHGRIDDRTGFAVSWTIDETMARSSHALRDDDGRVWLVDPVDWAPALERVAELGEPAGVVILVNRHGRDGQAIADRLGVPLSTLPAALPESPFELVPLVTQRWWRESALWWPQHRLLVVPEAIGTLPFFGLGEPAGVHPFLRLRPPRALRGYAPEHLLVGHGRALHDGAAPALATALDRSRRDLPRFVARLPGMIRAARRASSAA